MMPKKKFFTTDITGDIQIEQERIPVGCIPPALKPYMFQFQLPSLDITPGSGYHHQMSLAGGGYHHQIYS